MYIAIEGVIGVGKTTLARMMQQVFNTELLMEVFEENPFLARFYEDRERYAFQTQIFFLLSRYHQQRWAVPEILDSGRDLIADYTFAKDALFAKINLEGDELEMYTRVHEALVEKIRVPDLVVYLKADTPVLMQRIEMRDRPYERDMDVEYIDIVNQTYEKHYAKTDGIPPVLQIDTNETNIVTRSDHLLVVEDQIRRALKLAPYQHSMPI